MLKHGSKPVDTIVVHKSETRADWMSDKPLSDKVAEIRDWHVTGNGWNDIGYHWLIDRDGAVAPCRAETVVGAHVGDHNTGKIGICLIGGYGAKKTGAFFDSFTAEQDIALRKLIADIKTRATIKRVVGHCDLASSTCPGFSVPAWLNPVSPKAVRTALAKSSKNKVASLVKRGLLGTGAVTAGWPSVKEQLNISNEILQSAQELIASNGLLFVSGACIVLAIVFNWFQVKQADDFKEGRYTPSGEAQ